jgi:hypothetical protein
VSDKVIDRLVFWSTMAALACVFAFAAAMPEATRRLAAKCNVTGGLYIDGLCQHPARITP